MSSNKSTRIPSMVGKAVFEAGANTETVEFSSIAELREKEDELTWKHWPTELKIVSFDYHPAEPSNHLAVPVAVWAAWDCAHAALCQRTTGPTAFDRRGALTPRNAKTGAAPNHRD